MGKVTMRDVAAATGVSVATVSNAYNRPEKLSAQLRQRIFDVGASMGYPGPSAAGRALRSGKAGAFGVIYGEALSYVFTDPYAITLLAAFTNALAADGLSVNLIPVVDRASAEGLSVVRGAVVDGYLGVCASESHPAIQAALGRGLPVVLTDSAGQCDFVAIDDLEVGHLVGSHVAGLGHRNVAVVLGVPANDPGVWTSSSADEVLRAYDALGWREAGLRVRGIVEGLGTARTFFVTAGSNSVASGRRCTARLLDREPDVTAVVAVSDALALGVLDEMQSRGLEPGSDLAVTGVDGLPEALGRGLTTVRQPIERKGAEAARLLTDPSAAERRILLPVELSVGRSTAGVVASRARSAVRGP